MNQLTIKIGTTTKKINLPQTNSSQDLAHILESSLKSKDRIVGVTDEQGRFYDLQFLFQNTRILHKEILNVVTVKDVDEDNMSFASDNMENFQHKKQDLTYETQIFQKPALGYHGSVYDLKFFEELLLEEKKLTIVVCSKYEKTNIKIPYNFYNLKDENREESVIIYFDRKKVGEIFIDDWRNLQKKINGVVHNLQLFEKKTKSYEKDKKKKGQNSNQFSDESNKSLNMQNETQVEQIKNAFLENIAKLRDQQTISELQFYKLKAKLYENPQDFMRQYQMGTRQSFRKKKSIDQLRQQIVRSKEEKFRYQSIINEFKEVRAPSRESKHNRNFKNEIPIIVRKYNNVIEKISTSYPLNLQQEQAINLIMELQLKGLTSESESRQYKLQILQQQAQIFGLFEEYFNDKIDQIELAHKLKNKKKNQKKNQDEKNRSEDVVRMIIKHAKRNSFELLRNLAVEGNSYILKYYDEYLKDKNANLFAASLEKVANFYRAKNKLESDLEDP